MNPGGRPKEQVHTKENEPLSNMSRLSIHKKETEEDIILPPFVRKLRNFKFTKSSHTVDKYETGNFNSLPDFGLINKLEGYARSTEGESPGDTKETRRIEGGCQTGPTIEQTDTCLITSLKGVGGGGQSSAYYSSRNTGSVLKTPGDLRNSEAINFQKKIKFEPTIN